MSEAYTRHEFLRGRPAEAINYCHVHISAIAAQRVIVSQLDHQLQDR